MRLFTLSMVARGDDGVNGRGPHGGISATNDKHDGVTVA